MNCPLCQKRPTKRACPALNREICPTCCATKRIVEIACPQDCRHLESGLKHPAAVVKRQIDQDVTVLMTSMGRLSEQQLQLFFLLQSIILGFKPDGLGRVVDSDVAQAAGALAQSLETASRGLIYNEATPSVIAEGLRKELRLVVDEVAKSGGSRAEQEVAQVLRGIERGARHDGGLVGDAPAAYLELVGRVLQQGSPGPESAPKVLL
jgi:hypothetical protein